MAKSSSATASKWWSTISVSRNSGGGYTVNWKSYGSASAARSAIQSAASSAWGSGWWSISSWWSSGWSSWWSSSYWTSGGSSYSSPSVQKTINWTNFWFAKNSDWTYTISANWKVSKVSADSDMWKAAASYLWNTWTSTSNTGNKSTSSSSTWTGKYTNNSFTNYSNAMSHYISQGMTQDQAHEKAKWFLEDNPNYISKTSEEKEAEKYSPTTDEEDWNDAIVPEWIDNYNEQPDTDEYDQSQLDYLQDVFWQWLNDIRNYVDDFISNNTQSQVVESKSDVPSPSEAFDYNTYFTNNLVPKEDAREDDSAWTNEYNPNAPLTDVTKYQDDSISALESLWFLQPDTQAAEAMPDTEEQTTPEAETEAAADTPLSLVNWFDNEMINLENWLTDGRAINPTWLAQTYVDYRNRLAKYIKDNNISDDEAAAMFDSLKNNPRFRNLLQNIKR